MSKISIVLSAILVISGICAVNADSENGSFTASREDCIESIKGVETYMINIFDAIQCSTLTVELIKYLSAVREIIEKIEQGVPEENMNVAHTTRGPASKIIKCDALSAWQLRNILDEFENKFKSE